MSPPTALVRGAGRRRRGKLPMRLLDLLAAGHGVSDERCFHDGGSGLRNRDRQRVQRSLRGRSGRLGSGQHTRLRLRGGGAACPLPRRRGGRHRYLCCDRGRFGRGRCGRGRCDCGRRGRGRCGRRRLGGRRIQVRLQLGDELVDRPPVAEVQLDERAGVAAVGLHLLQ